jgi:hypothetical protein
METRQIRIGCRFTAAAEIDTPVVFHVQPRPSPDIGLTGERWRAEPPMAIRAWSRPCTGG